MRRLVLWDIDGTLLHGNHNGSKALIDSTQEYFGISVDPNLDMGGNMDRQIIFELTQGIIPRETVEKELEFLFSFYLKKLKEYYTAKRGVRLVSGIKEILSEISSQKNIVQGLLTGNIYSGAEVKLNVYSLNHHFSMGAFGEDGILRNELPQVAWNRAKKISGYEFSSHEWIIIGDTPKDVACAKHCHACSIAVSTDPKRRKALEESKPDFLFLDGFHDTEEVLKAILSEKK